MVDHRRVHYRNNVDFSVTTTHLAIKQLLVISAHWKSNKTIEHSFCGVFPAVFSVDSLFPVLHEKVQVSFNTLPAGSNPRIRRLSFTS